MGGNSCEKSGRGSRELGLRARSHWFKAGVWSNLFHVREKGSTDLEPVASSLQAQLTTTGGFQLAAPAHNRLALMSHTNSKTFPPISTHSSLQTAARGPPHTTHMHTFELFPHTKPI